ncbi:hypothetical protein RRG08_011934 [Elysia crispata]|uniref:Uncharacterized protein n=1 Tax=Elysia crispata TaxID=231223 RepID=A0AAE1CN98_9GAST|nr:hypothetical protein RRG08_011934 [Elysia crispata]
MVAVVGAGCPQAWEVALRKTESYLARAGRPVLHRSGVANPGQTLNSRRRVVSICVLMFGKIQRWFVRLV